MAKLGITPACAGNSAFMCRLPQAAQDHPRLRGEQSKGDKMTMTNEGSPPLARGTVPVRTDEIAWRGITPACAGNSLICCIKFVVRGDHPRLRGEQLGRSNNKPMKTGSPPLARGTAQKPLVIVLHCRITPACAGNSTSCRSLSVRVRDHPRLRGEQLLGDI